MDTRPSLEEGLDVGREPNTGWLAAVAPPNPPTHHLLTTMRGDLAGSHSAASPSGEAHVAFL